jgi:hypothetical protein
MTQINNSPNKQVAVDTEAHIMTIMEIKERNLES